LFPVGVCLLFGWSVFVFGLSPFCFWFEFVLFLGGVVLCLGCVLFFWLLGGVLLFLV
jgi:hypothetical protein